MINTRKPHWMKDPPLISNLLYLFCPRFLVDYKSSQDGKAHHIVNELGHKDHKSDWNHEDPPRDVHPPIQPPFRGDGQGKDPYKSHKDISDNIQGFPNQEHSGHIHEDNGNDILGKAQPEGGKTRLHGV